MVDLKVIATVNQKHWQFGECVSVCVSLHTRLSFEMFDNNFIQWCCWFKDKIEKFLHYCYYINNMALNVAFESAIVFSKFRNEFWFTFKMKDLEAKIVRGSSAKYQYLAAFVGELIMKSWTNSFDLFQIFNHLHF